MQSEPLFRVLVIDDNRDGADTLAILLRRFGYDVKTVYDGLDAMVAAESFSPDCIISDIGLPGLDGYALAERFRRHDKFRQTPLIALTAYSEPDRAKAAGFDLHVQKPPDGRMIASVIKEFAAMKKKVEETAKQQGEVMEVVKDLAQDVKEMKEEIKEVKEEVKEIQEKLRDADAE